VASEGNFPLPLESNLEQKVSDYAKQLGVLTLKLNVLGQVGWPDRLYLFKGRVLFIEFKRQGEQPRKVQVYVHNRIRSHGFTVDVVDNVQQGNASIDHLTHGS